jgi:hypothetical protein
MPIPHKQRGRHPEVYDVLAGRTDRATDADINDAQATIDQYPPGALQGLVQQLRNFTSSAVTTMATNGINHFIELGAGLPGHVPPAEGRSVVYVDDEPGLHQDAQRWLAPPREQFIDFNFWNAKGIIQRCQSLWKSKPPLGVVFIGMAEFIDDEGTARFMRDWFMTLPRKSCMAISILTAEGLRETMARATSAGAVTQKHTRITRKEGNTVYVRPANRMHIDKLLLHAWESYLQEPTWLDQLPGAQTISIQEKIGHFTGCIVQKQ